MTREEFLFELIDQCMQIACLDNILVENFELRDDKKFYKNIEAQFVSCVRFYDRIIKLVDTGRLSEIQMDMELRTVIAVLHQKAMKLLYDDLVSFLNEATIVEKDVEMRRLQEQVRRDEVNTDKILNFICQLRIMEQN